MSGEDSDEEAVCPPFCGTSADCGATAGHFWAIEIS